MSFLPMVMSASAYYSLFSHGKIFTLFQPVAEPLTEAEELRLDKLLESARYYHNLAFAVAGILTAISALEHFQEFALPFGGLAFSRIPATVGLYLFVLILLVISDRFFLMAFPWLLADKRRPPFAWIPMGVGLGFKHALWSGIIFYAPMQVSAIASTVILGDEPAVSGVLTLSALVLAGYGFVFLPRTVYYWKHLINERIDHRGSAATLSIHLLYWYRLIRQIFFSLFLIAPIVQVMPRWRDSQFNVALPYLAIVFGFVFLVRLVCGSKSIYRRIDGLGSKFGFPTESVHYP